MERFDTCLPYAVLVQLTVGVVLTVVIWPALRRLPDRWSIFLIAASTVLTMELTLFSFAMLLHDVEFTVGQAGWWWAIGHLPAFLSGAIAYMVREGLREASVTRRTAIEKIELNHEG